MKELNIRFRDLNILNLSLTHRSLQIPSTIPINNERLEFLGDSILSASVTDYLYKTYHKKNEGQLAKIKSYVVSEEVLSKIALNIHLDKYLLMGKGEEFSGGRKKSALLEDAMEALFGAYYLDRGFISCKQFILSLLIPEINHVIEGNFRQDYKTIFQEKVQKDFKLCPKYRLVKKEGPDHNIRFIYEVLVNDTVKGRGSGKSRKSAEQNAAKEALGMS